MPTTTSPSTMPPPISTSRIMAYCLQAYHAADHLPVISRLGSATSARKKAMAAMNRRS